MAHHRPRLEAEQRFAQTIEVDRAIRLIEEGLAKLNQPSGTDLAHDLILLPLAQGYERLLKSILGFRMLAKNGQIPADGRGRMRRVGHDLNSLLSAVLSECFDTEYVKRPAMREDQTFLASDPTLREMMSILATYGGGGRYYELDTLMGTQPSGASPSDRWRALGVEILHREQRLAFALSNQTQYDEHAAFVRRQLERPALSE